MRGSAGAEVNVEVEVEVEAAERARARWVSYWSWWRGCPEIVARVEADMIEQARASAAGRLSLSRAWEAARGAWVDRDGRPTSANNNMRAAAARALVAKHPDWRGRVEVRRSVLDEIDGLTLAPADWGRSLCR